MASSHEDLARTIFQYSTKRTMGIEVGITNPIAFASLFNPMTRERHINYK